MHQSIAAAVATPTIVASTGLFSAATAAFLVAVLDVDVAWRLYVLRRPAHAGVARPIGGLRVVRAAASANAS